jgi:hypothetical protein
MAGLDGELGHGPEILAAELDGRAEAQGVRPADGLEPILATPYPGDSGPVVESDDQLEPHGDGPAPSLDDADHVEGVHSHRHAVAQHDDAGLGLEFRCAEKRRKAGRRVEARDAEPVDRAIPAHERRRLAVPDDRVILDGQRHDLGFPFPPSRRTGSPGRPVRLRTPAWLGAQRATPPLGTNPFPAGGR